MPKKAKGLPNPKDYGAIKNLKPGQIVPLFVQKHDADVAGQHHDLRLGDNQNKLLSWAVPKGIPSPGEKRLSVSQPLHSKNYGSWEGEIKSGYGKGKVTSELQGKALVTDVDNDHVSFVTAHEKYPQRFRLQKTKKDWLLINTTPDKPRNYNKIHYSKVDPKDVEKLMTPENLISSKIDGSSSWIEILGDKIDTLSYRTSKKTGRPIIHTERMFGKRPTIKGKLPPLKKVLKKESAEPDTVLRGETYAEDPEGKPVPAAETGGILNQNLLNSLQSQKQKNLKLKTALFDILKYKGEDVQQLPYEDRLKLIKEAQKYLPPEFWVVEGTDIPEEQKKLWNKIRSGQHPLTSEGIVSVPKQGGKPSKSKTFTENDVYIRGITPGEGKYKGIGAGGLRYSLTPEGPIRGVIGTGLSDEDRQDLWEHPENWKGRIARIQAQAQFPSGAFRAPRFIARHEDYSGKPTILDTLKAAKEFSDIEDYNSKNRLLRKAIKLKPNEFKIDSEKGNIIGLTHKPTGFQIHAKKGDITDKLLSQLEKTSKESLIISNKLLKGVGLK